MNPKTILVIDDDSDLRETFALALESENYQVLLASNGKRAFEILAEHAPSRISCIVLDLMMPEMDGNEFLLRLRKERPEFDSVPVVIATATGESSRIQQIPSGMRRIEKPMNLEDFYRVVDEAARSQALA
jgi:CheY-like chemotaxis protein